MYVLVLLQPAGGRKRFPALRARMGPGADVVLAYVPLKVAGVGERPRTMLAIEAPGNREGKFVLFENHLV